MSPQDTEGKLDTLGVSFPQNVALRELGWHCHMIYGTFRAQTELGNFYMDISSWIHE